MVHKEERIIYGKLITQGREYDLLNLEPQKALLYDVPVKLRDNVAVFLGVVDDKARALWVSHWSGFVIIPMEPKIVEVAFEMEDEVPTISNFPLAE